MVKLFFCRWFICNLYIEKTFSDNFVKITKKYDSKAPLSKYTDSVYRPKQHTLSKDCN